MEQFARWLVRHPLLVLIAHAVVTIGLGSAALQVRVESSLESVLPGGDPEVHYYNDVRATFGSDDVAVIGVRAGDLFSASTLEKIARVTDEVGKIEGVDRVYSITNAIDPAADVFDPPPLLPHIPPTAVQVEELKQKLQARPVYGKNLVADDMKGAAVNVFFRNLTDAQYEDLKIDDKIDDILNRETGPEQFFFTGAAHIKQEAVKLMRRDLTFFTPIALVCVLVVLWLSFRTVRGVVLPLVSVLLAVVWTLGVMVLLGKSITIGTFVLPPLLLVVGSSYAIHVVARYYEQVEAGVSRDQLVVRAFDRVWLPLLISVATTTVGFGSLMMNRITAIWDLGFFSVIGLAFLTITSLGFLPASLELLHPRFRVAPGSTLTPRLVRLLRSVGQFATERRAFVLWSSAILGLAALSGVGRIRVDSDFLAYFDHSSPVRQANEAINETIVGSNPFYLVVDGTEPGILKRWEVLKRIKELQMFLTTLPGVSSSLSLVDYFELFEAGLQESGKGDIVVDEQGRIVSEEKAVSFWDSQEKLEPILSMVATNPKTFKSVVTEDFRRGNILVRTKLSGSRRIEESLTKIRAYISIYLPAQLKVHPTGNLVLLTGTASDIVSGQVQSLVLALVIIFAIMSAMFLSFRIGFLAVLPNVLPVAIFFGVLGWFGFLLNLGTSLIATIALGIAVDSAVHYMARLNLELRGETDQAAAQLRTIETVGLPIAFTTIALFLGFMTFAASSFVPVRSFGILTGFTMATSLLANLVLLPALLSTTRIITLWDLVRVKLGKNPGKGVPLFAGLRPLQARIVVLMGRIRRFEAGQSIIQRGELGDEMYVVLQGQAEVWVGAESSRRRINVHSRGEVFGEMGLLRHVQRSADVVAIDNIEVLAMDENFLKRIRARYPRIAAKVFMNLNRILSDRLQSRTDELLRSR